MKACLTDIQTYCLHDGPGIRTCVFFKGCPLRCDWCHNPEAQRAGLEFAHDEERCDQCGRCEAACQHGALRLAVSGPVRDPVACVACGHCVDACLSGALQKVGFELSPSEMVERLVLDRPFFEASGGGVTLTGGEPTFQSEVLLETLDRLAKAKVHTALETCGAFSPRLVDPLCERVDLFLFDVKHLCDERHRSATGASNHRALENFASVIDRVGPQRVVPRIALIPDFNADRDSLQSMAAFLSDAGAQGPVHLLPHHGWAAGKYRKLGRVAPGTPTRALSDELRAEIERSLIKRNLEPIWT